MIYGLQLSPPEAWNHASLQNSGAEAAPSAAATEISVSVEKQLLGRRRYTGSISFRVLPWHSLIKADQHGRREKTNPTSHSCSHMIWPYRCLWTKQSFCASPRPAVPQRKLLSSPWFGALEARSFTCYPLQRSCFFHRRRYVQTPLNTARVIYLYTYV